MPDTPPPTVPGRFEWDVPDELFDERFREEEFLRQLKEDAVVKLFKAGRVSSGYAASLLGMTRRDFLELLQKRGVPFVRYTEEDLEKELRPIFDWTLRFSASGKDLTWNSSTKKLPRKWRRVLYGTR